MAALGTVDDKSGGQKILRAIASVDLPSALTLASGSVDVTITGLLPGDLVSVYPLNNLASGGVIDGNCKVVSAADTVTVRWTNASAGTVDPAAQVMSFVIYRNSVPL